MTESSKTLATFAGGCFWCFDAIFRHVRGVEKVESGFAGGEGRISYETIHYSSRGYAEAVQVTFDPAIISYVELLDIFWHLHDPTQINKQGHDVGSEYRSAVFYHSKEQKELAESTMATLDASGEFSSPIVTDIKPFSTFIVADEEHQNFYNKSKMNPYCLIIIDPKIAKLKEKYYSKVTRT
jgi:peptide-methionine (S)-S-oxide reductase